MSQNKQLSILEFSRLTGIKRDNLRFYDRIGLLKPESRGENGYRYYTRRQLGTGYLIGSLRLLGVGLEDIRAYSAERTPDKMMALFAEQEARIRAEIARLRETSEIMKLYADMAREALRHDEDAFLLEERKRERIFLCPPISPDMEVDEGEILAYEYAGRHGVNLGYPMGVMVSRERLLSGAGSPDYRYYLKSVKGGNAWKPAGLYAVAYGRYEHQDTEAVYRRFMAFIEAQGLEAAGDLYGEYLLSELAVRDPEQYSGRIEVPVRRAPYAAAETSPLPAEKKYP